MNTNTIQVSELFGPTIQGEGSYIGKPCFFLRLHNCPVQCPGCDTHYTWDKSEAGKPMTMEAVANWFIGSFGQYPKCGLVLTGGEPLLQYANQPFRQLLHAVSRHAKWMSLETSGFVGPIAIGNRGGAHIGMLYDFLRLFNLVTLSPKVTPCLHGEGWTDDQLLNNVNMFMQPFINRPQELQLKLVCRDEEDVAAVAKYDRTFGWSFIGHEVYLMAYGQEPAELLETCRRLVPLSAKYGYPISPRLHSLLWGRERLR